MKKLFLIKTEILSNKHSAAILIMQIIFAIICFNICTVTVNDYIETILYFAHIDTKNAVTVYCSEETKEKYNDIMKSPYVNDGFYAGYYLSDLKKDGNIVASKVYIAVFPESILTSETAFLSKKQIEAISKENNSAINVLVTEDLTEYLPIGSSFILDNNKEIFISGTIANKTLYHICNAMTADSFIMAVDSGELNGLPPHSLDSIFITLNNITADEFANEINEKYIGLTAAKFDLNTALSKNYSRMAALFMFGLLILIISVIGFFSNAYFTYKRNENVYNQYRILGTDRLNFFAIFGGVYFFELTVSVIASALILLICENISDAKLITLQSFCFSVLWFILMIFIALIFQLRKIKITFIQ